MDKILVKYLLAETTEVENRMVEQWLEENVAHRNRFQQFKTIWEESRQLESRVELDESAAWERFQLRIQKTKAVPAKRIPLKKWNPVKIAAGLLLILSLGSVIYFLSGTLSTTRMHADDQIQTALLPDNSKITLNKLASLKYRNSFNKKNRIVQLDGEAFFEVKPNKNLPFQVQVEKLTITVVGTAFNVKEMDAQTEIIVEHGIVQVESAGNRVTLHAGQKAEVDNTTGRLEVLDNKDKLYQYYRTREFICYETPLSELIEALSKMYNRHIIIQNPQTAELKITTRFYQEDLDDVLQIIATTLNVRVSHENEQIIIY